MFDLKKFRADLGLKQSDLQDILEVTQGFISRVENGRELFPKSYLKKLEDKFGEDMISKYYVEYSIKKDYPSENFKLIPLLNQDVVGGISNEIVDTMGYITGYLPFVNAKSEDIAVPVTNDSMYPVYAPGTVVQIRKIEHWREYIEFGQVHIIELEDDRRLIKEVRKSNEKGKFKLVSANPKYDDSEVNTDFIRSVWLVIAKYQKVVM